MFAQQNQLKEIFQQNGWELIEVYEPKEWWIAEIWIMKSLWSPNDCKVYLSFLVDPQLEDRTKAKLNVWVVDFSLVDRRTLKMKEILTENKHFEIVIKTKWEKRIPEIVSGLNKLRNNFEKNNGIN